MGQVLIASGYPNNPQPPNNSTIEAPLTINIPNTKAVCASSDDSHLSDIIRGTKNVTISVSVPKQPLSSGVSGEKRLNDEVTEVNPPSRKRRRSWTLEEDTKLTASVQNHGERNWENIARGDFKNDRTASELSHVFHLVSYILCIITSIQSREHQVIVKCFSFYAICRSEPLRSIGFFFSNLTILLLTCAFFLVLSAMYIR